MNRACLLWALTSGFFFFEWFLRVSPGVLLPFLEKELHANLMNIGTLSVMFYYPYLLMQIPVGVIVDRFNIKYIMLVVVLLFGLATVGFAQMSNLYYGYLFRFVMGLTGSFAFIGTLKIVTLYFAQNRAALLTGITQGLGMLGAVAGLSPMYYCFVHYGWRETLICLSIIFFVIAGLISLIKVATPNIALPKKKHTVWSDFKTLATNKAVWFNAGSAGCFYAPTVAFGEQWGLSFLSSSHLMLMQASGAIAFMFIGMVLGCPILGLIADKVNNEAVVIRLAALCCLILISLVIYGSWLHLNFGYFTILILLFCYGFFQGALVVFYTLSTKLVSLRLTGVCIGLTNMASVMVGAIFIQLMAYILQYIIYHRAVTVSEISTVNFQLVFLSFPVAFIISIILSYLK